METQPIGKHLEQLEKGLEPLNSLEPSKTSSIVCRPPSPENKILEVSRAGKHIGAMSKEEISLWGKTLLLKIYVITGWVIPAEQEMVVILVDQFSKKLLESYPNTNTEEIEFAFRHYSNTVKDWGKNMNLILIDQVMGRYLADRKYITGMVEGQKDQPPPQRIYTQDELDNFHRQWTEEFYQQIRRGIVKDVPIYTKEILVKDGLITAPAFAHGFFVEKLNSGVEHIYQQEKSE